MPDSVPKENVKVPEMGFADVVEEAEEEGGVAVKMPERVSQGGRKSWIWEEVADTEVMG